MSFAQFIKEHKEVDLIGQFIETPGADFAITNVPITQYHGKFNCEYKKLTSLKGAPKEIIGDFTCANNRLETLKYGPEIVNGNYSCSNNRLETLKYGPRIVRGNYYCIGNNLISLEGGPEECDNFNCGLASEFTSLAGVHNIFKKINGTFTCRSTRIKSHVLGLLLIKNLERVALHDDKVNSILNTNMGIGRKGVLQAQQELIEAGFTEYAQL